MNLHLTDNFTQLLGNASVCIDKGLPQTGWMMENIVIKLDFLKTEKQSIARYHHISRSYQ